MIRNTTMERTALNTTYFDNKKSDFKKLIAYGFEEREGAYVYGKEIADGQLFTTVKVTADGKVSTETVDIASGEVYSLHLVDGVSGAFVGAVRADIERVIEDIARQCFYGGIFRCDAAQVVTNFAKENFGDELEFLWDGFPKDAVLRRKDSGKWYALFVELKREKLGLDGDDDVDIAVIRALPDTVATLPDGKLFLPAYHMNKKTWLTAVLKGDADTTKICQLLAVSYDLAKK